MADSNLKCNTDWINAQHVKNLATSVPKGERGGAVDSGFEPGVVSGFADQGQHH